MSEASNTISKQLIDIFENVIHMERDTINKEANTKLSMTEIHTIAATGSDELESMSVIAGKLHVTVGTLTVAMKHLSEKGYVERYKSEKDRRIVKIGLTKQGKEIYRIHEEFHRELGRRLTNGMTEGEALVVKRAIANLEEFIRQGC